MRIPSGVTDQYLYFVAVDATDFTTRETGLSSFTVYRSRNGGTAAAYTSPTINETDTTNMPGVYELLLDEDMTIDAGDDSQEVCLHITHTGMAPVTRTFELYRPKITAGETIGVSSGAVSNVTLVATTTTNTDMRGTDSAATASALSTALGTISDLGSGASLGANLSDIDTAANAAATPAEVNAEMVDVMATDTYAEPSGVIAATSTLAAGINWIKTFFRNTITQTATTQSLRNDANSGDIATSTVSDDGTTATRGEFS